MRNKEEMGIFILNQNNMGRRLVCRHLKVRENKEINIEIKDEKSEIG